MKADVLPFPQPPDKVATPLPTNHQTGDTYLRVDVTDDALMHVGLFPGAFVIVLRGVLWDHLPHALEFEGETYLGVLRYINSKTVEFFSWHDGEYSGVYQLTNLTVLGAACDFFPFGERGPCWSLSSNPRQNTNSHSHGSLLQASVN